MPELSNEQLSQIDYLISQDKPVNAMMAYRKFVGVSINEAIDAINKRLEIVPLPPPEDPGDKAFQAITTITCPIIVVEVAWGGDTRSPYYLALLAITEGASREHPRFTSHLLCLITPRWVATQTPDHSFSEQTVSDLATQLGRRLAASVNADFYLTSETVDDVKRWWDMYPSKSTL